MWVVVHILSGMALGAVWKTPRWVLVPVALLLHILLDLVPHWDYTRSRGRAVWASLDVAVALGLFAAAWVSGARAAVLVAGAVSALPDLDVLDALFPGIRRGRWFPSHWARFPHGRAGPGPGIASQAVVMLASAAVLALAR